MYSNRDRLSLLIPGTPKSLVHNSGLQLGHCFASHPTLSNAQGHHLSVQLRWGLVPGVLGGEEVVVYPRVHRTVVHMED